MKNVPVTYIFCGGDEATLRWALPEFAANKAKHVVLNDNIISEIMKKDSYSNVVERCLDETGLTFVDAHAPFGPDVDMNVPVKSKRRSMILRHKLSLNIAKYFNVDTMTIHTGNDARFPDVPLEQQFDLVAETVSELLGEAEKCGVVICVENIWFRLNTPDMLLKLKELFPSEYLGFCYDAGHANLMTNGKNFAEGAANKAWGMFNAVPDWNDPILEKMLPYIVNCHLHDNNGETDRHQLCGKGVIDWQKIIPLLKSAPNLRNIQCESLSSYNHFSVKEMVDSTLDILKY